LRARVETDPGKAQLRVNEQTLEVVVSETAWTEIRLNAVHLQRGSNQLKWTVQQGTIELDWMDVQITDASKQAVGIKPTGVVN
jgi:hypothetical protein